MNDIIILYMRYELLLKKKKEKNRKMWVRPLLSTRLSKGAFPITFESLKKDSVKYFNYFRMSVSAFDELLTTFVGHKLIKMDTNMRKAITPVEKLAVTLREVCVNVPYLFVGDEAFDLSKNVLRFYRG